jgi:hypothetical protein
MIGSGNQETRGVGFARTVFLFRDSPGVMAGRAVASFSIGRANAVTVLRDLHGGPMEITESGDQSGNDAGFADVASVSADDE